MQTETKQTHTAQPEPKWRLDAVGRLYHISGKVAQLAPHLPETTRRHVLDTLNSHNALYDACKAVEDWLKGSTIYCPVKEQLVIALAKAEGRQE